MKVSKFIKNNIILSIVTFQSIAILDVASALVLVFFFSFLSFLKNTQRSTLESLLPSLLNRGTEREEEERKRHLKFFFNKTPSLYKNIMWGQFI